mmetsp:Transcript_19698/g.31903  ORF Transcript_19698/g.31903 Transcript_19698/m.31903 type:complete len:203 (+) Transcript_19698:70-678(+)
MFTPFRWITVRVLSTPPRTFDSDAAVPAISDSKPIACLEGSRRSSSITPATLLSSRAVTEPKRLSAAAAACNLLFPRAISSAAAAALSFSAVSSADLPSAPILSVSALLWHELKIASSLCRPKVARHSARRVPGNNSAAPMPVATSVVYGCSAMADAISAVGCLKNSLSTACRRATMTRACASPRAMCPRAASSLTDVIRLS